MRCVIKTKFMYASLKFIFYCILHSSTYFFQLSFYIIFNFSKILVIAFDELLQNYFIEVSYLLSKAAALPRKSFRYYLHEFCLLSIFLNYLRIAHFGITYCIRSILFTDLAVVMFLALKKVFKVGMWKLIVWEII